MIDAYPLCWPVGWPRKKHPNYSQFRTTFAKARDGLLKEIKLLGGKNVVISSNISLRLDGLPYANQRNPDDTGVAFYFYLFGESQCIPCDKWNNVGDNLQAIRKTVEALRGLERWGAKEVVKAAFKGFVALPSGTEVRYFKHGDTKESAKSQYHEYCREFHPDLGGDSDKLIIMTDEYNTLPNRT